jgi:hypothetical protein
VLICRYKVIINVHDEICFYIEITEISVAKEIIERLMMKKRYDNVGGNTLELNAELEIGEVWKYTKSLDYWSSHKDEYNKWVYSINKRNMENENMTIDYFRKEQQTKKVEPMFDNYLGRKKRSAIPMKK